MGRLYDWAQGLRAKHDDFTRLGQDVAEVKDLLIALTGAVEQVTGAGVGPGNLDPPKQIVGAPEDGPGMAVAASSPADAPPFPPEMLAAPPDGGGEATPEPAPEAETSEGPPAQPAPSEKDQVVALVSQALEDPTLLEQVKGFLHMFGVKQG